jgi:DNA-binding Lrp family transcriptional regulator
MLQPCKSSELDKQEKSSWRDTLPVHPAAELFPLMSSDELRALGADIVNNGLTSSIALWRADPKAPLFLLDGRNRLDAIEMATGKPVEVGAPSLMAGKFSALDKVIVLDGRSVDPWAYVVSANIYRRHLTIEDKDRLIVELLRVDPTKSNRQVAKIVDVSHPHVAKVRKQAEQAGDVETVTTSVDTRGRKQPAKKAKQPKEPVQSQPVEPATASRGDIGATSTGEAERLEARNGELENKCRQLEFKNEGLESEVGDLKAENAKLKTENTELKTENAELRAKLEVTQTATAEEATQTVTVAASSETATADTVTAGDPGPFPEFLLRKPEATDTSKSSGGGTLGDAVASVFRELGALGCERREQVENAPDGLDQSPRIQALDDTANALEDLNAPDVPAELAEIKVNLPKQRKPRTLSDRRDVDLGILTACVKALLAVGENDTRHQMARTLCGELQSASAEIEGCEF